MSPREHRLATSVLVVGTGAAGLRAAIELAEAGVAVTAVGRHPAGDDVHAAPVVADSWEQRAADTLLESCLLADPRAVELLTRTATHALHDLERYGMRWGGEDEGMRVQRVLRHRATRLGIPMLSTLYVTRLLVDDGSVFGAYGFDVTDGSRFLIHADAVVLAAGGYTGIWRHTCARRHESTGNALRLAAEAGARLRDVEFVQFHPFGVLGADGRAGLLLDENDVATEGFLLNSLGERFMARYGPERMERSGRDRVLAACYSEIKQGRGTAGGGVWLDLSHLSREAVVTRLPRTHQLLLDLRTLDISADPIEVTPIAHYSMGGVRVRPDDQSSDVDGLFVSGEAAGGLHGANPLAGNAVIELLVCGRAAGRAAARHSARLGTQRRSLAAVRDAEAEVDRVLSAEGSQSARALHRAVRNVMTEYGGAVRDADGLSAGLAELATIEERMADVGVFTDISGYRELADAFDLRSGVLAARATLECAFERCETRGAHRRADHPETDPALRVSLVWSPGTGVRREALPPIPSDIAELMTGDPEQP